MGWNGFGRPLAVIGLGAFLCLATVGCSSDGGDADVDTGESRELRATIHTTTGGVPHIVADNLESAAFGEGYVQARDNVCLIADSILRARGERAKFYGPGPDVSDTAPIGINVVTDFSIKALGLWEKADTEYNQLSANAQQMLRGFAAGYNKYVAETEPADLPAKCANQSWVRDISPQDLYAYYQLIALYASGDRFATGVTFFAAPPGVNPAPSTTEPASAQRTAHNRIAAFARNATPADLGLKTDYREHGMASNGWGIGGEMTENGRGALLANPHFPYTGNRRLYQSQITVPGVYDVNGAALIGFVIPLIGFNENVAWTHTVSTAQHFTLYQLQLAEGNDLAYVKDGQQKPIEARSFTVEVANGTVTPTRLTKTFYYSEYGPMIAANVANEALPAWGDNGLAFTYRDANADAARQVVDQWLGMGQAENLDEFKAPFEACGSVLWVNTMYSDDSGQAFYIDGTSVPDLSEEAITAFAARSQANPVVRALAASGLTLLDGSTSRDDWIEGDCGGRVAYAGMPKLARRDFVQNSNDSYWATNPDQFLTGYSPLYGPTETALSPRTRMGLTMLQHPTDPGLSQVAPAGSDGKFTGEEIIKALYSNRAYYAETLLDGLLTRCDNAGDTPIATDAGSRSVAEGCTALAGWDGVYDTDSRGAHVFRVFMANYAPDFTNAFDPASPVDTPNTPAAAPADPATDPMLHVLARGLDVLDQVGIPYNARLGQVQRQQQSAGTLPGGTPTSAGEPIPWPGNQNLEGGFNIVRPDTQRVEDGTRFPRIAPAGTLAKTGDLSSAEGEGWLIGYGTSWHFGLSFTEDGPKGYGLVSYSQSDDAGSDHFADQDQRFSSENYRSLLYAQADIQNDAARVTETITTTIDARSE